jgi:hypothetical protein
MMKITVTCMGTQNSESWYCSGDGLKKNVRHKKSRGVIKSSLTSGKKLPLRYIEDQGLQFIRFKNVGRCDGLISIAEDQKQGRKICRSLQSNKWREFRI